MRSLEREDALQTDVAWGLFRISKGLKCVERREAGRGAGVHAPQAEFTFRAYLRRNSRSAWKQFPVIWGDFGEHFTRGSKSRICLFCDDFSLPGLDKAFEWLGRAYAQHDAGLMEKDRPPRGGLSRIKGFVNFTTLPFSVELRYQLFGSHLTRSRAGTTLVRGCYRSRRLLLPYASRRNVPTRAG